MKILSILLVAAALCAPLPVEAQKLDLAIVTCKDFTAIDKQTVGMILMWLEGYYSEENASPIVSFDKMRADGGKISEYCVKNPGRSVFTAADEVLGK